MITGHYKRAVSRLLPVALVIPLLFGVQGTALAQIIQPLPPPGWFVVANVSWGSTSSPIQASPGDTNIPLFITIQNIGNSTVAGVIEQLVLNSPFTNITGGHLITSYPTQSGQQSTTVQSGSIAQGQSAVAQFLVNIALDARLGEYVLKANINYLQAAQGVGQTLYLYNNYMLNVPVQITGRQYMVIYGVTSGPPRTVPGGNMTVSGNIVYTQTSVSAYNATVYLSSPVAEEPQLLYVGEVDPSIPRPFSLPMQVNPTAQPGTYPIEIRVTYIDTLLITHWIRWEGKITVLSRGEQGPTLARHQPSSWDAIWNALRSILDALFGSI